ncbi:hypothetical protein ACU4GR_13255 [Methylobacterium oryzae CBMB20]
MISTGAAFRNATRHQIRKVLMAAKAVIEEQANDGGADAGG